MNFLMAFLFCVFGTEISTTGASSQTNKIIEVSSVDGRMFDSYGDIPYKEEKQRLDNLAAQLNAEPQSKGYIVVYRGKDGSTVNLKTRACRAIQRIVNNRAVNPEHIVALVIDNGLREEFTVELWLWPLGASDDLPRFQLGVSQKEVSVIRGVEMRSKCGGRYARRSRKRADCANHTGHRRGR